MPMGAGTYGFAGGLAGAIQQAQQRKLQEQQMVREMMIQQALSQRQQQQQFQMGLAGQAFGHQLGAPERKAQQDYYKWRRDFDKKKLELDLDFKEKKLELDLDFKEKKLELGLEEAEKERMSREEIAAIRAKDAGAGVQKPPARTEEMYRMRKSYAEAQRRLKTLPDAIRGANAKVTKALQRGAREEARRWTEERDRLIAEYDNLVAQSEQYLSYLDALELEKKKSATVIRHESDAAAAGLSEAETMADFERRIEELP